jgi:hypothetical protein
VCERCGRVASAAGPRAQARAFAGWSAAGWSAAACSAQRRCAARRDWRGSARQSADPQVGVLVRRGGGKERVVILYALLQALVWAFQKQPQILERVCIVHPRAHGLVTQRAPRAQRSSAQAALRRFDCLPAHHVETILAARRHWHGPRLWPQVLKKKTKPSLPPSSLPPSLPPSLSPSAR